jgi:hypothetical protein
MVIKNDLAENIRRTRSKNAIYWTEFKDLHQFLGELVIKEQLCITLVVSFDVSICHNQELINDCEYHSNSLCSIDASQGNI